MVAVLVYQIVVAAFYRSRGQRFLLSAAEAGTPANGGITPRDRVLGVADHLIHWGDVPLQPRDFCIFNPVHA